MLPIKIGFNEKDEKPKTEIAFKQQKQDNTNTCHGF